MNTIVLDNFYNELILAEKCASEIVDIDEFRLMVEADTEEVQNQLVRNEDLTGSAVDHLKKAVSELAKMISNLISSIGNTISNLLSSKKKANFSQLNAACKSNPELAKKKITVFDSKRATKELNALSERVNKASTMDGVEYSEDPDQILADLEKYITGIGSGFTIAVTAEMMERYASSSIEAAKDIEYKLQNDQKLVAQLEAGIGVKETKKFKKRIHGFTKRITLQRKLAEARGKTAKNMGEGVADVINEMESLVKSGMALKSKDAPFSDPRMSKGMKAIQTGKYLAQNKKEVKDVASNAMKNASLLKKLNGNENIHGVLVKGKEYIDNTNKAARAEVKAQDKAARYAKRHNKYYDQSAAQSISGTVSDVKDNVKNVVKDKIPSKRTLRKPK